MQKILLQATVKTYLTVSQMLYFLSHQFPFGIFFLITQHLQGGKKHAEWGMTVVLEPHVSLETVTANLPGVCQS